MADKIFSSMSEVVKDVHHRFIKAGINTVNIVAANARNNAIKNVQSNFTLRNDFTIKQIGFSKCAGNVQSLNQIKSETGITERASYMERQEHGGLHRNSNGNLVIPTTKARGGSNEKPVRRSYYYSAIRPFLIHGSTNFKSKKAAHVARAFVAANAFVAEKKHGFIRMNNSIFKVTSFRKNGENISFKSTHILNLKYESTHTPKKKWLEPASDYAAQMMQEIFNQQMDKLK